MDKARYVAIFGNIGAGKTTLFNKLQEKMPNAIAIAENYEDNIILEMFYKEMLE